MIFNPPPSKATTPTPSNGTPVPSSNNPPPPPNLQQEIEKSIKIFESNLKIEFRNINSKNSTRDRLASLLATLKQGDPHFKILPTSPASNLPTITTPTEVPINDDILFQYLTPGTIMNNGTKHHLKVSSALRINKLKHIPVVFSHLDNSQIFITHNNISSTDITSAGWIFRVNPDAYSRQELHSHIVKHLREKGHNFSNFQLNARKVSHGRSSSIQTRAWVLELDKEEAKTWLKILLAAFPIGPKVENRIQIVPFSLAAYTSEESIKKVFYLQNKSLVETSIIRIDNLRGIKDTTLINNKGHIVQPIQQLLLGTESTQPAFNKVKVFHDVIQYNSGRVTCLVKKELLKEAQHAIDYLLDTFLSTLTPDSKAMVTFSAKSPIRIGRSVLPEHIAKATNAIQSLEIDFDCDDASLISAYSTPPKTNNNQLYSNKKTYANALCSDTTQTTQPMTISPTIASSDLTAERFSRIDKLLAHLTEKNATLETTQTALQASQNKLQASIELALDQFTSLTAKFENQQAILEGIMKSIAAINQQLTSASPPRKQSRQTTHTTMHNQTHQLTNHLPLHATPMICDT